MQPITASLLTKAPSMRLVIVSPTDQIDAPGTSVPPPSSHACNRRGPPDLRAAPLLRVKSNSQSKRYRQRLSYTAVLTALALEGHGPPRTQGSTACERGTGRGRPLSRRAPAWPARSPVPTACTSCVMHRKDRRHHCVPDRCLLVDGEGGGGISMREGHLLAKLSRQSQHRPSTPPPITPHVMYISQAIVEPWRRYRCVRPQGRYGARHGTGSGVTRLAAVAPAPPPRPSGSSPPPRGSCRAPAQSDRQVLGEGGGVTKGGCSSRNVTANMHWEGK